MKQLRFFICLLSLSAVWSQWTEFNLERADISDFQSEILPVIRHGAMSAGHAPFFIQSAGKRLRIGLNFSRGMDLTRSKFAESSLNWIPTLYGSILVTSNLHLKGKLGGYSRENSMVQIFGFGLGLQLTQPEQGPYWELDIDMGQVRSPRHSRLSTVEMAVKRIFTVRDIPVFLGLGTSQFKAIIYSLPAASLPSKIESQLYYVKAGTIIKKGVFHLAPQLAGSPKFWVIIIDVYWEFH